MFERTNKVNSITERRSKIMNKKTKANSPSEAVAAALLLWARAATTCLSSKKRKTAAMRRRLKDLKVLDMGGV